MDKSSIEEMNICFTNNKNSMFFVLDKIWVSKINLDIELNLEFYHFNHVSNVFPWLRYFNLKTNLAHSVHKINVIFLIQLSHIHSIYPFCFMFFFLRLPILIELRNKWNFLQELYFFRIMENDWILFKPIMLMLFSM